MTKIELLDTIRAARDRLESALGQLNDEQMLRPGLNDNWSGKDLLAHIGWWELRAVHLFESLKLTGTVSDPIGEPTELDALNAKAFADNSQRSLPDVRRYERDAYQAVLTLVENASDDDLFNPQRFAWTNGQPFVNWIAANTYGHYDEHMQNLLDWVKTVSAAPSR